jgi:hypothetical protein
VSARPAPFAESDPVAGAAVTAEAIARVADVDAEEAARIAAVAAEAATRGGADSALTAAVAVEATARQTADLNHILALLALRYARVFAHGHSGMAGVGGTSVSNSIAGRLAGLLKSALTNGATGGAVASWHTGTGGAGTGEGGYPYALQAVGSAQKDNSAAVANMATSPYLPWPVGSDTLGLLLYGFNDLYRDAEVAGGPSVVAQSQKALIHALRAVISRYRQARIIEDQLSLAGYSDLNNGGSPAAAGATSALNAADTLAGIGGWANAGAFTDRNSGSRYSLTSTVNDGVQLLTAKDMPDDAVIVLGGITLSTDDVILTATVSNPDGSSPVVTTLDVKDVRSPTAGKYTGYVLRFKGPWNGQKLIKVRMTTRTAGSFRFDYWAYESPIPTPVVVGNMWLPNNSALYSFGSSEADRNAKIVTMNQNLAALAAEFAPVTGGVNPVLLADLYSALSSGGAADPQFFSADNLHLNDLGQAKGAATFLTALTGYVQAARDPLTMAKGA